MEPIERTFTTRDGVKLFTKVVEKGSPYWLICTHGVGEHLQRHSYINELFGHDFNIFHYDLRGHGKSSGESVYIDNFETYLEDLEDCINYLREKYHMKKFVLFGHSMGALITCGFAKKYFNDELRAEAIFVNAPPVGIPGALGKIVDMIPDNFVSKLASVKASLPVGGLVDLKFLSHNPAVREDYIQDDLNHLKLHSKLALEIVRYSREVFSSPINSGVPSFCTYGSKDGIINVSALEDYFTNVEKNFEVKKIKGAYHEIQAEIEKYRKPYFEYLKRKMNEIIYKKN